MEFFYLHGFASSPRSTKARDLYTRLAGFQPHRPRSGIPLHIPDLNQGDFTHLTLTRQLHYVRSLLPPSPTTIIGSSFGGLAAAWLAEYCPQIERLILLAPAFRYLEHWLPSLGDAQLQQWQAGQPLQVYHHGAERWLPLAYEIVSDLQQYRESNLQKPVPTLILHGVHDEVIPVQVSRDYVRDRQPQARRFSEDALRTYRAWVHLIELNSNHALTDQSSRIWQEICQFCFH
ncbi:YqiA/YcfP family alpha/beta fold hydrolase [Myxacorys almedinensis]|uniref:Alpha/beta fold hydrolase n=1 Tax=Myxacorys almedinensis A TaxID=2690445 RepID=A0A8J8CGK9_9CYAN|nr:alpha/beta fold hydrolase [Myxacorys almedinensis A]